jgi:8-oxo-dGTP pyrophosphatase MutT (NUDIX family)
MTVYPFSPALFDEIRGACAAFERSVDDHPRKLKRAAVGIVLVDMEDGSGEAGFLLTLRAASLRSHGGQLALPGGRIDVGESAIDSVIRECAEELGLALAPDDVLGVLDDYATRSGYAITPVVIVAAAGQEIVANPDEVARVLRISLREITRDTAAEFIAIAESDRPVVRLNLDETHIHAPTAAMLFQFAELMVGRTTRVTGFDEPVFAWR